MPAMPGPARKYKILCEFFQKRAIKLQAAVNDLTKQKTDGQLRAFPPTKFDGTSGTVLLSN